MNRMICDMPNIFKFSLIACFCAALSMTVALKCFRCGEYTPDGAGSVIPCYTFNETDLKECHTWDRYCLKYMNKGIIVRDCVQECKPGIQELSEFFCCQEDGCNTAGVQKYGWTIFFAFGFSFFLRYMSIEL